MLITFTRPDSLWIQLLIAVLSAFSERGSMVRYCCGVPMLSVTRSGFSGGASETGGLMKFFAQLSGTMELLIS